MSIIRRLAQSAMVQQQQQQLVLPPAISIACRMVLIGFLILESLALSNVGNAASPYDSTAYIECLLMPRGVLYEGRGMISNPDFEDDDVGVDEKMGGWSPFGGCDLQRRQQQLLRDDNDDDDDEESTRSKGRLRRRLRRRNTFLAAVNRSHSFSGPSIVLAGVTTNAMYTLSAWVQVNDRRQLRSDGAPLQSELEEEAVKAIVKATVVVEFPFNDKEDVAAGAGGGAAGARRKEYVTAGTVEARSGCWSFLKGGFSLHDRIVTDPSTSSTTLYFETVNFTPGMELWLDNVALQSFGNEEWVSHRATGFENLRRRTINLHVRDEGSISAMANDAAAARLVRVEVEDTSFKLGAAIDEHILEDARYQKWFVERFNMAVFENEMKWYSTERVRGQVSYNVTDAMVGMCEKIGVGIRGHCIFWEDPTFQPSWLHNLAISDPAAVQEAASERLASLVGRYSGQLLHWDVSNELLHFSFFEDAAADPDATIHFFQHAQSLDPAALLFLNDYNTIENADDVRATPEAYISKLRQLQSAGVASLAIGLEAHFTRFPPNLPYMRAALDKLRATGVPVWLTELDVDVRAIANQTLAATYLQSILEEAMSHPAVSGILLWAPWKPSGHCYRMCLTDPDMVNLPVGDVVDEIIRKWKRVDMLNDVVDDDDDAANAVVSWRGPVGTHRITLSSSSSSSSSHQHPPSNNATHYSATFVIHPGSGPQHIHFLPHLLSTHDP